MRFIKGPLWCLTTFCILGGSLFLASCQGTDNTLSTPTPSEPDMANIDGYATTKTSMTPTMRALIQPSSTPSATSTITAIDLNSFSHDGISFKVQPIDSISFDFHPTLGEEVTVENEYTYDQQVGYTSFSFVPGGEFGDVVCMIVYPVDQFLAAYGNLVFPPAGYGGGAAVILESHKETLEFKSGSGTRSLEMHGQMAYFANNGSLRYVFRGYSDDKRYAIYLQYPIETKILFSAEAAFDPAANTNPGALTAPTASPDDPPGSTMMGFNLLAHNQQISQRLELLDPQEFTPSLDILDALVTSIRIEEKSPPGLDTCPEPDSAWSSPFRLIPGQSITSIFSLQIQEYLNACGIDDLEAALSGPFAGESGNYIGRAKVTEIDVTGDALPEVVVDFGFLVSTENSDGAIFIYGNQTGSYQLIATIPVAGFIIGQEGPSPAIRTIQDMNGDGVPEMVISYIEIVGTHGNYGRVFKIMSWDGNDMMNLLAGEAVVFNGDGEIQDSDGDGIYDLVLNHGAGYITDTSTTEAPRSEIWAWNGDAFVVTSAANE